MEANKILLQRKFARIIESLAKEAHITEEEAMGLFYTSKTYVRISSEKRYWLLLKMKW